MIVICWSAKGGAGTTVVAAALALSLGAHDPAGCLAVDLAGDLPAVFGVAEPPGPGVVDWMVAEPAPDRAALLGLQHAVGGDVAVVARGAGGTPASVGWSRLADVLASTARPVVIDAGCGVPAPELLDVAAHSLLVTRPCYLALRRATSMAAAATGIVLIDEPSRALGRRDVATALALPVVAVVPFDPAIARAVDAGLLASRLPNALTRALRSAAA